MTTVRDASPRDIERVVAVHRAAFQSFFLTSLGPRFLARLYGGYLAHPSGILLVAGDGGEGERRGAGAGAGDARIRGFVAGTTDPEAFYGWLRRSNGLAMALAAAPALARRPLGVGRRLASAVRYRGQAPQRVTGAALLASLAVHPDAARQGMGGVLVAAFVERALEAGRDVTYLSTDVAGNDRVLEFYRRQGFHEAERVRRSGGREMAILIRGLGDTAAAHTAAGKPAAAGTDPVDR
jgi:ribosomal protein S18 acetylase RimI-like enzyme